MKIYSVLLSVAIISGSLSLQACPLIVENDTDHMVVLIEKEGPGGQMITPGQKITFGDDSQHLFFDFFKGSKNGRLVKQSTIRQHTCTMAKKVETTVSALEKKELDTRFFEYVSQDE